jgi:hypothetical protein
VLVWMFAAPLMGLMTVVVGFPTAFLMVVRQSRGALLAVSAWFLAARYGVVGGFDGPFRLPWLVGLPVAVVFGWMFCWNLIRIVLVAWGRAWGNWILIRGGMPPNEVV